MTRGKKQREEKAQEIRDLVKQKYLVDKPDRQREFIIAPSGIVPIRHNALPPRLHFQPLGGMSQAVLQKCDLGPTFDLDNVELSPEIDRKQIAIFKDGDLSAETFHLQCIPKDN